MSYFTEAFHALDYGSKGYILIKDFKNEMQKYVFNNDGTINLESEKTLNKFISLINLFEGDKVYFDDFIKAIQELDVFLNEQNSQLDDKGEDDFFVNSDLSPFINDGDNYSTGDSGFSNDLKTCHDLNNSINSGLGKHNRKLIKKVQQIDTIQGKDLLPYKVVPNDAKNYDYVISKSLLGDSGLPQDDSIYGMKDRRRQSDFVACVNRRDTNRKKHNIDDDAHSLNCWNPCSGSAADLFYHDSMTDIQNTLEKLERSMENLQTATTDSKQSKRKYHDENYVLLGQIQSLEEKLKESQKQYERDLNIERETARKNLTKLEKSKFEEIEYLKWSLKSKDDAIESQWKDLHTLSTDNERLQYDKLRCEDQLLDLQQQMTSIESEMMRLKDFHNRELNVLINERNILFSRNSDLSDRNVVSSSQKADDITRLRSENSDLKRKLEECESEFLALSVQQGCSILQSTSTDSSWRREIDGYTKDEVVDLLVKEKDGNFRLREYVNRILTRIIDKDPSLLEI